MKYYQCELEQNNTYTVGFIPEKGAKVGLMVELPDYGGFWKVLSVGHGMTKEELSSKQASDRKQRQASDI